jgi:hypothetical protein
MTKLGGNLIYYNEVSLMKDWLHTLPYNSIWVEDEESNKQHHTSHKDEKRNQVKQVQKHRLNSQSKVFKH